MNIFIGLSKPKKRKIGAELIDWFLNINFSHCYLRFEKSSIPSTVYHATGKMVHFIEFSHFREHNEVVREYIIPVTNELKTLILIDAIMLCGRKYGYLDIFKIFLTTIFKKRFTFSDSGYICSELVGSMMEKHLGYKFDKDLSIVTPKDIDTALNNTATELYHI
jgi:hypothetical protein